MGWNHGEQQTEEDAGRRPGGMNGRRVTNITKSRPGAFRWSALRWVIDSTRPSSRSLQQSGPRHAQHPVAAGQRRGSAGSPDEVVVTTDPRERKSQGLFCVLFFCEDGWRMKFTASNSDFHIHPSGNNDFLFYQPDLIIGVVDPLRPNAEVSYYPGEVMARISDIICINPLVRCDDIDDPQV